MFNVSAPAAAQLFATGAGGTLIEKWNQQRRLITPCDRVYATIACMMKSQGFPELWQATMEMFRALSRKYYGAAILDQLQNWARRTVPNTASSKSEKDQSCSSTSPQILAELFTSCR
ncbi:hypothetical protein KRP22_002782 [Phytophthora ramorum]|nr:hypothetical protein KRP22_6429 [Phytophthora ramorum]